MEQAQREVAPPASGANATAIACARWCEDTTSINFDDQELALHASSQDPDAAGAQARLGLPEILALIPVGTICQQAFKSRPFAFLPMISSKSRFGELKRSISPTILGS